MVSLCKTDKTNLTYPDDICLRNRIGNFFFWLGMLMELTVSFSGHLFGGYHEYLIIVIGMACFAIKIALTMDIKKDFLLFLLCAIYGLICYKVQHSALILRIILILLAGRDQDAKKIVKLFFFGTLLTMIVTCILSCFGLYNSLYVVGLFRHTYDEVRYTFGFFNPNGFTLFLFRVMILGIYAYYDELKIWGIALIGILYMPFVYLSDSKTGMGIGLIAIVAFIISKLVKKEGTLKLIYILGNLFMIFEIGFSYFSMIFFDAKFNENGKPIGFWQPVNQYIMTGRFSNAQNTYLNYPLTFFGMAKGTETTEMDFVSSLYNYGIVFIILYCILLFALFYKMYKQKNKAAMVVIIVTTLYSLAESFLVYVNKNAVLMIGIGVLLDFCIVPGKTKNEVIPESNKKTIKIDFVDFWTDLDKENNFFTNILKKYYNVVISKNPDYVFFSNMGRNNTKYRKAVKIFFTGENIVPDFNNCDYALGFQEIGFGDRYRRLPLYALYTDIIERAKDKHKASKDSYDRKFCNYVISNPDASDEREEIINAISEYSQVDSGGRYRNNVGGAVQDKLSFASGYRFSLALENSGQAGYTTEKILEAFAAGTVPIYWGNPDIKRDFNEKAFINASDFSSMEELKEYVAKVNEDKQLYMQYMEADILGNDVLSNKYFDEEYTAEFLCNIFDQDINKAYRRNMVYYGKRYEQELRDASEILDVIDLIKKPIHYINKLKLQIVSGVFRKK